MPRGTLEVGLYEPPVAPASVDPQSDSAGPVAAGSVRHTSRPPLHRYSAITAGALSSLLLHIFLIVSVTSGGGLWRAPLLPENALSRGNAKSERDSTLELVWVDEPDSVTAASRDTDAIAIPTLAKITVDASLAAVSIPALSDSNEAHEASGDADSATQTVLLGRYVGQIDARIERAWRRPRTPVQGGDFSCRVKITQNATGAVQEIALEHCNGGPRWQLSLVQAIELASPLPAPPDPRVFTRVLRMNFRAQQYSPQSLQEDYEPALIATNAAAALSVGSGMERDPAH